MQRREPNPDEAVVVKKRKKKKKKKRKADGMAATQYNPAAKWTASSPVHYMSKDD